MRSATYETTILSTTTRRGAWTQAWTDLSAWAGQTVIVTFSVQETTGRPCTWAAVDDVSLGSWLTPVPQAIAPYQFDVWTPGVITITGQNFIGPSAQIRLGPVVLMDKINIKPMKVPKGR